MTREPKWNIAGLPPVHFQAPRLMAILNVTPDSFSDGGLFLDPDSALRRARDSIDAGADMIDIGAESTRPGAARVNARDQLERLEPVLKAIRQAHPETPISVDTTRSEVANAAMSMGANVINDVSGGTEDPELLGVVARHGAGVVLMHRRLPPDQDRYSTEYDADAPTGSGGTIEQHVASQLAMYAQRAQDQGISGESIVVDPGLGFGKSVQQNLQLLHRMGVIVNLGFPVLCGASRKSFLAGFADQGAAPADRLAASIAAAVVALASGVRLFRVHDVAAHREALDAAWAMLQSSPDHLDASHPMYTPSSVRPCSEGSA